MAAIKATATLTITTSVDIISTTIYYLLQSSTASPPSKPTTDPPGGNWSTTEPTYTEGSTNTLYTVTKTKYSGNIPGTNTDFEYTPVSKSTSYEAAKTAYIKAYNTENDLNNYINSTELIIGTQTAVTGSWTGVAGFSSLTDGQEITYWLPYNGNGNATLNLTLSNGSTTGAKNVYYSGTSRCTTHYSAGNIIRMVYRVNVPIGGSGSYTGWWCDANYDSNNYDRLRFQNNIKVDEQYIPSGRIIASKNNDLYSIIKSNSSFKIDSPILFAGSNINPVTANNNTYLMYSGVSITNNLSYNCEIGDETFTSSTVGYSGTAITGTSTTATVFSGSGISSAKIGDLYINTSTYYLYKCTVAGNASTAKWVYVKSLYTQVGKRWYNGTAITGTSTTATVFSGSGISNAGVGDYYYNTNTGYYYECTVAGNASTAKWVYDGILIETYKTIYLRGTLLNGIFTVDKIPFTTTIPITDDGLYYISLGSTYGLNSYGLFPEHPMYKFIIKGQTGEFKSLNQVAYEANVSATNAQGVASSVNGRLDTLQDQIPTESYIKSVADNAKNDAINNITQNYADSLAIDANAVNSLIDAAFATGDGAAGTDRGRAIQNVINHFDFNSQEGIKITADNSDYYVRIDHDSIDMMKHSTEQGNDYVLSSWEGVNFIADYIRTTDITIKSKDSNVTGQFKFIIRSNGSLSIRRET